MVALLSYLREYFGTDGKIETISRRGKLVKVTGWSTSDNLLLRINQQDRRHKQQVQFSTSDRTDLSHLTRAFDFVSCFGLQNTTRCSISLSPRPLFQRAIRYNQNEVVDNSAGSSVNFSREEILENFSTQCTTVESSDVFEVCNRSIEIVKLVEICQEFESVVIIEEPKEQSIAAIQMSLLELFQLNNDVRCAVIMLREDSTIPLPSASSNVVLSKLSIEPVILALYLSFVWPAKVVSLVRQYTLIANLDALSESLSELRETASSHALTASRSENEVEYPSMISIRNATRDITWQVLESPYSHWNFDYFILHNKRLISPSIGATAGLLGRVVDPLPRTQGAQARKFSDHDTNELQGST